MDILKLSRFTILSISENEHDFLIQVEMNSPPSHCPHCGCVANLYKHSNRDQLCIYRSTESVQGFLSSVSGINVVSAIKPFGSG